MAQRYLEQLIHRAARDPETAELLELLVCATGICRTRLVHAAIRVYATEHLGADRVREIVAEAEAKMPMQRNQRLKP